MRKICNDDGGCNNNDYIDELESENKKLCSEIKMLRTALGHISGPCTNYTRGTDCMEQGRIIDTTWGAERVCDACIARDALQQPGLFA